MMAPLSILTCDTRLALDFKAVPEEEEEHERALLSFILLGMNPDSRVSKNLLQRNAHHFKLNVSWKLYPDALPISNVKGFREEEEGAIIAPFQNSISKLNKCLSHKFPLNSQ